MKKLLYSVVIASVLITVISCGSTAPVHSIGSGKTALMSDLNGVHTGIGVLKNTNGDVASTFQAEMLGYTENGVTFLKESYLYDSGDRLVHTYRLTPSENPFTFDCIEITTLAKCTVLFAGNTINMKMYTNQMESGSREIRFTDSSYHILSDTKIIKHSYFNKFIGVHNSEEIVHYTRDK